MPARGSRTPSGPVGSPPSDRIQGLSRGLRILEYVHASPEPLGVKELAAATGLKLGTAYHLVNTLIYEGYLVRGTDRLLRPGRLPAPAPESNGDVHVQRAIGRAAYAVDDVAVLARLAGPETRVTAAAEVPGAPCGEHYPVGAADLSHLLAVGRVILAHQPESAAEEAIELTRRLASLRGELFDERELRDDLQASAERRWCALVGENDACVAAPVLDRSGLAIAAVAVVIPPRRLRGDLDALVAAARTAARDVTRGLQEDAG
jgi:IclR family acetate operon transcriptional repressor